MSARPLALYVVDDDEAVRRSLSVLLVSRGYGVQPFGSGEGFLAGADLDRPGCVVLDLRMPGLSGLQVQDELIRRGSPLSVIFLSGHGDIPTAVQAVRQGAIDWLEKPCDNELLLDKVAAALAHALSRAQADAGHDEGAALWQRLTPREREVAALVARGHASKVVARLLVPACGPRVVETHRGRVFAKLEVANATELAHFMLRHAMLTGADPAPDDDAGR